MIEKINQKGFIQIPLLIGIIVAVVITLGVGVGVILHKQGKLAPLVANISQVSTETEKPITTEIQETNQEELPEQLPVEQESTEPQIEEELEQARLEVEKAKQEAEEAKRLLEEQKEAQRLAEEQRKQEELQRQEEAQKLAEKQELLFKVTKVIDGDTIKLENGEAVRYIGIDTPETVHPSKPVQCFGKEASDKNKELVEGKLVKLEKDITDRDKYGRLLQYVWVGDLFVNDYLLREGYAYVYTYPPDIKYFEQFVQAQKEARENNRGLWAGCLGPEVVEETPPSPPVESTPPQEGIICSYNAYNCSDFSTHTEAQGVFEYCGGVTNDVHRLDADKDGLACESLP